MKAGIDNYGLFPLSLNPFQTLEWASSRGAEGVAFSGLDSRLERKLDNGFLRELRQEAKVKDLYLEWGGGQHLPFNMSSYCVKEILTFNRVVCEEAAALGAGIVRSCSGGLMRWHQKGPSTEDYLLAMESELKKLKPVLDDLDIQWAIETHFEFTSWELVRLFERAGFTPDGRIGICLDTMNLLTMLEDPVKATKRLLPWIQTTHIKDGGLVLYPDCLKSYPAMIGEGWIRLDEIIRLLRDHGKVSHLNLEDHNGFFELPVYDQAFTDEFPDLDQEELREITELACASQGCRDKVEKLFFDRSAWPMVCNARMTQGLKELLKLRDQIVHEQI